jgi:L,D-transpeptidase ErfK/SrfK
MKRMFAICLLLIIPSLAFSTVITGGETVYRIVDGDGLLLISAKFGVNVGTITRKNHLNPAKPLQPGQELRLDTRKIAPHAVDNGIVVDIPGRMLYYFKAGNLEMFFPVGLGMPQWHGLTRWRTPSRTFTITGKERNPKWYVPESIQWQLHVEGKPVLKVVPPGPNNPLGRFALYTSIHGIAIHETIWPTTVFQFRSHGCIRVLPENIERFYDEIEVGTPGELVYQTVKAAVTDDGKVFLEVDPDIYGKVRKPMDEVIDRINDLHAADEVDWVKIKSIVHERSGIAEDVTLLPVRHPRR